MTRSYQNPYLLGAVSLVAGTAIWWAFSLWLNEPTLLPAPPGVAKTAVELTQNGLLPEAMLASFKRVVVGYALGVAAGIVTGLLLGQFRALNEIFGPVFEFMKGIPPIALVPMMILWFGIGELPRYLIVAYIVWIIVTIGTFTGATEIPDVHRRAGQFMGLSHTSILLHVILPSAMPYALGAMRTAIGFAFIAVISAELIAARTGLGFVIMDARFNLQTSQTIVGLLALGILGNLSVWAFDFLTSRSRLISRFMRK